MSALQSIDEEEEQFLSPSEIWEQLVALEEMILTVPIEEEEKLRSSLASAKSKALAKMKEEGAAVDLTKILKFETTLSEEYEGCVSVRVSLVQRSGIRIKKIQLPDPEF